MKTAILCQAHHENWGGGRSYCLSRVKGVPVISYVLGKLRDSFPLEDIVVAVPDEKENSVFEPIALSYNAIVHYGSKANVLDRYLGAAEKMRFDAFLRVVAEHYFVDVEYIGRIRRRLNEGGYDIVTPPPDFDPKFGAECVTVDALKKVRTLLSGVDEKKADNALANPIQFMASHPEEFSHFIESGVPTYSTEVIMDMRDTGKEIYLEAYEHADGKSQLAGDVLRMHYEIAKNRLGTRGRVLDIACGNGWGSAILASAGGNIVGADLSAESISEARKKYGTANLSFDVKDAVNTGYPDGSFSVATSMDTIEHIEDDHKFLREMQRVIKKGGLFIVSTPQNSSKGLPLIPYHVREYNLADFKGLLLRFFDIRSFYSFRSNLVLEGEVAGTGMMAICERRRRG